MPCDTYSNTNVSIEYDNCINCLEELLSQYEQDDISCVETGIPLSKEKPAKHDS